ncbi:MAG: alpha/beta hydrolase [Sphingobacteriales bacterium]|nr:MAG: alpha/beta hydrolase [Sphingobacteriales bacterium]
MKFTALIISFFLVSVSYAQEFIPLWPAGKKPNNNGTKITDSLAGERIWKVSTPGMYAFPAPSSDNNGTAVLICPGGGYQRLSHIYNGFQIARWFNTHGVNAYVLIYRLPHQTDLIERTTAALQDAQRAMKILNANATQWKLHKGKIGVMGTSAGGHLASSLGTHKSDISIISDSLNNTLYRPDFMLLLSPVISMGAHAHKGSKNNLLGADTGNIKMVEKYSNEFNVSSFTPPTFIVHAVNDKTVNVRNSLLFYNALIENNINASLHTFPQGGHGIRMTDNPGSTNYWLNLMEAWLKETGFVVPVPFK